MTINALPHDRPVDQLIRQIHASEIRLVLAVTGGGSRAISQLLEVPGASRTLLEAIVPYSEAAWMQLNGGAPDRFCSPAAARSMAMTAFLRAMAFADPVHVPPPRNRSPATVHATDAGELPTLAGVGSTASLASDRPKRGPHRVHVAIQTATMTAAWSVALDKGRRSRLEEEVVCSRMILTAIARACGIFTSIERGLFSTERIEKQRVIAPPAWTDLLLNRRDAVLVEPAAGDGPKRLIFPGAFHPLHAGHRQMARIAERLFDQPVAYELSVRNADKPPLDFIELDTRLQPLRGEPVWITRAATFAEKAAIFPGATFVVGVDTLARIGDPKYYGGIPERVERAIGTLDQRHCRFLVFGRQLGGTFRTLEDLALPPRLRDLCRQVPEREFHSDLSSTKIRHAAHG